MGGFALLLVASGLYVACSSDDNTSQSLSGAVNEINFRALGDRPVTKASSTVTGDITSFTLQGIWNGSAVPAEQRLFDAVVVTRSEDGSSWDYSPKKTWPATGDVRFFAYSPANSVNVTNGFKGDVEPTITYTVPTDSTRQEDLLVAVTDELNTGTVPVNFKHALSRVLFRARSTEADVPVKIEAVKLKNLCQTGTWKLEVDVPAKRTVSSLETDDVISIGVPFGTGKFEYASYAAYATDQMPENKDAAYLNYASGYEHFWQVDPSSKTDFPVDLSESNTVGADYSYITGATQGLMVMPQATVYSSSTTTPATGDFYVEVSYSIGGGAPVTKNIRVYDWWKKAWGSFTFEPGKQYTFDLSVDPDGVIVLDVNSLADFTMVAVPKDYVVGDIAMVGIAGEPGIVTSLDSPSSGHGWALCATPPLAYADRKPSEGALPTSGAAIDLDWAAIDPSPGSYPLYDWFKAANNNQKDPKNWNRAVWLEKEEVRTSLASLPLTTASKLVALNFFVLSTEPMINFNAAGGYYFMLRTSLSDTNCLGQQLQINAQTMEVTDAGSEQNPISQDSWTDEAGSPARVLYKIRF